MFLTIELCPCAEINCARKSCSRVQLGSRLCTKSGDQRRRSRRARWQAVDAATASASGPHTAPGSALSSRCTPPRGVLNANWARAVPSRTHPSAQQLEGRRGAGVGYPTPLAAALSRPSPLGDERRGPARGARRVSGAALKGGPRKGHAATGASWLATGGGGRVGGALAAPASERVREARDESAGLRGVWEGGSGQCRSGSPDRARGF